MNYFLVTFGIVGVTDRRTDKWKVKHETHPAYNFLSGEYWSRNGQIVTYLIPKYIKTVGLKN